MLHMSTGVSRCTARSRVRQKVHLHINTHSADTRQTTTQASNPRRYSCSERRMVRYLYWCGLQREDLHPVLVVVYVNEHLYHGDLQGGGGECVCGGMRGGAGGAVKIKQKKQKCNLARKLT